MTRDIRINPKLGSTSSNDFPTIDFGGLSSSSISLKVDDDGSVVYTGTYGALFSVTDNKDGLLHSVNDISGLPILQVHSNDYVQLGKWDKYTLVANSDKVGIGLTAPSTKFHIYATQSGAFRLQDGTQNAGYLLTSDSNGVGSWTSSSNLNLITGSGSTNYVPKWTSTTGLSSTSSIYIDGNGNVGIGTTSLTANLHIVGTSSSDLLKIRNSHLYNNKLTILNDGSFYSTSINTGFGSDSGIGTFSAEHLYYNFKSSFSTYFAFTNAGLLGNVTTYGIIGGVIGSASTNTRLTIVNNDNGSISNILKLYSESSLSVNDGSDYTHYALDIQTIGSIVNSGSGTHYKVGLNVNVTGGDVNYAAILNGGNVGINTSSPTTKLHVYATQSGAFRLQDGTQNTGYVLTSDSNGVATWTQSSNVFNGGTGSFGVVFSKGDGTITTSDTAKLVIPFSGYITGWRILEISSTPVSSSIVVDVKKTTYDNYPSSFSSITGSEKPTLSSVVKNQDTTLTTWTTSFDAGDIFEFDVESVTSAKNVSVMLMYVRTINL